MFFSLGLTLQTIEPKLRSRPWPRSILKKMTLDLKVLLCP